MRSALSIKDENLETAFHVLRFFDLIPKGSSLNAVGKVVKEAFSSERIREDFLK